MIFFSQRKLTQKQKEIVRYIEQQRKEGHRDGRIRTLMEVHGYTPEDLNIYFQLANQIMQQKAAQNYFFVVLFVALFVGSLFFIGENTGLTGAIPWNPPSWFTPYDCGDDYPADANNVMDLSDCVADDEETRNYLLCYVNNTVNINKISPEGINDEWYSTNVDEDISSIITIDTVALLESSFIFPWSAATENYDNVDCFRWNYGVVRTKDWHLCNATDSGAPQNLVFYYTDIGNGKNVSYGGLSTSLVLNSSYYLCYDELECTTDRDVCNEDSGYHCVGRLDSSTGSSWYPCDTTLNADYYRCCKGGCDGISMMCAGRLLNQEGTAYTNFTSCVEDGTTGCCDESTDCVYDGECYDYKEVTTFYDINMECREENHWCPKDFRYDTDYDNCIIQEEACYDSSDEAYCNSIFGTDDIDIWGADSGCIRPDPDGVVYNESCVPTTLEGVDYYFYQDITWY